MDDLSQFCIVLGRFTICHNLNLDDLSQVIFVNLILDNLSQVMFVTIFWDDLSQVKPRRNAAKKERWSGEISKLIDPHFTPTRE